MLSRLAPKVHSLVGGVADLLSAHFGVGRHALCGIASGAACATALGASLWPRNVGTTVPRIPMFGPEAAAAPCPESSGSLATQTAGSRTGEYRLDLNWRCPGLAPVTWRHSALTACTLFGLIRRRFRSSTLLPTRRRRFPRSLRFTESRRWCAEATTARAEHGRIQLAATHSTLGVSPQLPATSSATLLGATPMGVRPACRPPRKPRARTRATVPVPGPHRRPYSAGRGHARANATVAFSNSRSTAPAPPSASRRLGDGTPRFSRPAHPYKHLQRCPIQLNPLHTSAIGAASSRAPWSSAARLQTSPTAPLRRYHSARVAQLHRPPACRPVIELATTNRAFATSIARSQGSPATSTYSFYPRDFLSDIRLPQRSAGNKR
jgi:hypothetical protein